MQKSCWQTPYLTSATTGQRRFCEEINIPLCWIRNIYQISCSSYRSLNWLYYPFLSIFLACLSGWVYSLVKHCKLGHAPALHPAPRNCRSCCLTRVSLDSFSSGAAPEATSCNLGCSEHTPAFSMARTGDFSTLRERRSHLNSPFLGHIKNVLPRCKDWILASTLTVWAVWRFMMSFN